MSWRRFAGPMTRCPRGCRSARPSTTLLADRPTGLGRGTRFGGPPSMKRRPPKRRPGASSHRTLAPRGARGSERRGARGGYVVVLLHAAGADTDAAGDLAVLVGQHHPATEDDQPALRGGLDAVQRGAGLHQRDQVARVHLEVDGGERLLLRDVGADELGPVHTRERYQLA